MSTEKTSKQLDKYIRKYIHLKYTNVGEKRY